MRTTAGGSLPRAWAIAVVMAQAISSQSPAPSDPAPFYAASSVVNAASPVSGGLAPNTLATIYGRFLSYSMAAVGMAAVGAEEVRSGVLPTVLFGTAVRVLIGNQPAPLLYVSPDQINFVVPSTLRAGSMELRVSRGAVYGPGVPVNLREAAPALFQADPEFALSVPADAAPGDVVTLYATGLGDVRPRPEPGQIVTKAAPLTRLADFRVQIEGLDAPVLYAGLAPGFAGLYQVNVTIPTIRNRNPEIRIGFEEEMSPAGLHLHASLGQPTSSRIRPGFQLDLFQELYAPCFAVHSVDFALRVDCR